MTEKRVAIILKYTFPPIRQCLKGYFVACNLSKEINKILTKEATGNKKYKVSNISSCQLNHSSVERGRYLSRIAVTNMDNRPSVIPNSKSATVRFIIRYVLRLRNWWLVAKVPSVKAFTKTMKTTSVT